MIATSVTALTEPLPEAAELDARLGALRRLFPRAIVDRYLRTMPAFGTRVVLAPGAAVVGDVELGDDVSIWYGAVLRGDLAGVSVGARSNIQDGSVVHVADGGACRIGEETVVGHRAMLHACRVGDGLSHRDAGDDPRRRRHRARLGRGRGGARDAADGHPAAQPRAGRAPRASSSHSREKDEAFHRAMAHKYVRLKETYRCDSFHDDAGRTVKPALFFGLTAALALGACGKVSGDAATGAAGASGASIDGAGTAGATETGAAAACQTPGPAPTSAP